MAEYKISQLTAADALSDTNLFEVVQTVSNRKGTFAQIKTWIQSWLTKSMVGLGNVDNIASGSMPVSTAQQAALDLKANTSALASYLTISGAASTYIPLSQKGAANGVTPLGADNKIASIYLPSFVDDVLEYAAVGNFPATGESGKIYVATGTNKTYRWSGSTYVEISASPGSTDAVPEGASNLYFTNARAVAALSSTLAGYLTTSAANSTYMPRSGGTFSGAVAVPAGFLINAQGGDWGGFISLAKAPNGALTNPTILQYQNKILFFENGGAGRGAYIDLASLSSWANNRIITTSDLSSYATQSYVQSYVNGLDFATEDYVNNALSGAGGAFATIGGTLSAGSFIKVDLGANLVANMAFMGKNSGSGLYIAGMSVLYNLTGTYSGFNSTNNVGEVASRVSNPTINSGNANSLSYAFDSAGRYVYFFNRTASAITYSIQICRL